MDSLAQTAPEARRLRARDLADVVAAMAVALLAGLAFLVLPAGAPLRVALGLAVLFLVPGYLLLESFAHPAGPVRRLARATYALGLSPAVVGLAALSTALLPGGFKAAPIVLAVTLACLGLGAAALRHRISGRPSGKQAPSPSTP